MTDSPAQRPDSRYAIELPVFEGPLDLLLHLVKKHELDIFDIPIAFVTEKYLSYLEQMRSLHIDIAGEYLLMAATLAYIKSRQLLPVEASIEVEEEVEEGDPRQELIRRLLEYQKYKEAGGSLGERPVMGRNVFGRGTPIDLGAAGEAPLAEVSVIKLIEALGKILERAKTFAVHDVVVDRISIADRIHSLVEQLETQGSFTFESCFVPAGGEGQPVERHQVVVTFLALLEMTRLKMIRLHQPEGSVSIYIARAAEDLSQAMQGFRAEEYEK